MIPTSCLPPRIAGTPKATLEVRIDLLKSSATKTSSSTKETAKFIKLQWWGQTQDEAAKLSIECGAKITYNVLARPGHFQNYLRDAGRLYLETLSHTGKTLGFAVIERLERIVTFGGISADDVEVFNKQGQVIAVLRCIFMFEEIIEDHEEEKIFATNSKKVTFNTENAEHDYDEVVSQNCEDNFEDIETAALKRIMEKSNQRLNTDVPATQEPIQIEVENKQGQMKEKQLPPLPSWNLSTDRLKFISQVTSLSIEVKNITLNPALMPHVSTFNTKSTRKNQPNFCIKYTLPNETDSVTFCASKQQVSKCHNKVKKALQSNILAFDGAAEHPLRFTTKVLDSWWISSINFNLFSRYLGQRLPMHIGDTNLGMKYLLINSKYSSGADMKLPMYSSTSFRRHLEPYFKEEIIGDVHLSFNFKIGNPQKQALPRNETPLVSKPIVSKDSPPKITLESKTIQVDQECHDHIGKPEELPTNLPKELVLCLLRIDQGRGFSLDTDSLYITCRLFSDAKHISSSVAWNSNSNPRFELQHVTPIETNIGFLEHCCKNNHLVVEVWNFAEPTSQIVGITTISLHQLYTAFHDETIASKHLSAEIPVIAVHDWLSVRDVLAGGKIVGEIRVLLAAGLGTQVYRLNLLIDEDESSYSSKNVPEKLQIPRTDEVDDTITEDIMDSIVSDDKLPNVVQDKHETPNNWLKFNVEIKEGRNLPLITSKDRREPPVTYVSISNGLKHFTSDLVKKSCRPQWNFQAEVPLSEQLLTDPKRQLIAKVWHKDENVSDYVIGFAAIDLGILLHDSFTEISGWYNVMDFVGRCRGQINVNIKPKSYAYVKTLKQQNSVPPPQKSPKVPRNRSKDSLVQKETNCPEPEKPYAWQPPTLDSENEATRSVLEKKLKELDILKSRLSGDSDPIQEVTYNLDDRQELERLRLNLASQFQSIHSAVLESQESNDDIRPRSQPDGGNPPENDT